jgi:hypothetical protein
MMWPRGIASSPTTEWIQAHPREGDFALLDYSVSKAPELANALDPSSEPAGKTTFVIDEYYASQAGIAKHWGETPSWPEWASGAAQAWIAKATITTRTTTQWSKPWARTVNAVHPGGLQRGPRGVGVRVERLPAARPTRCFVPMRSGWRRGLGFCERA